MVLLSVTSCALNRTYISDYTRRVELLETNFPEIYQLYCNGIVIIYDVYIYEEDGKEKVGITYKYR